MVHCILSCLLVNVYIYVLLPEDLFWRRNCSRFDFGWSSICMDASCAISTQAVSQKYRYDPTILLFNSSDTSLKRMSTPTTWSLLPQ